MVHSEEPPNIVPNDKGVADSSDHPIEAEELEENIAHIAKEGDLSPKQMKALRSGFKRAQSTIPLQVKTRSSKDKGELSSQ